MAEYIFTTRNGIHIIDLQKTVKKFEEAYTYVRYLSEAGGTLLFVGTKKQAADSIREEAIKCGMFYVNVRWPGGMLTNFKTIRRSIGRLNELEKMQADGTFNLLPKKEAAKKVKEIDDLEKIYGGIKNMDRLPDAVFRSQRRQRGEETRYPGHRDRRYQLRSRRRRLYHPGQRRRDPRSQTDLGRACRRRDRGQGRRSRRRHRGGGESRRGRARNDRRRVIDRKE